jgi:hypothetical protein
MTNQQPDNLVTKLAKVIATSRAFSPTVALVDIRIACAVLDSGLVVPAADAIPKQAVRDIIERMILRGDDEFWISELEDLVVGGES